MPDAPPVFNIVVTDQGFWHLRVFVCSLLHNSDARFRLVANACGRETLDLMEDYASAHPERVVEVVDLAATELLRHGVVLDAVRGSRHDGDLFCFVDPDIKAKGPFLATFSELLKAHSAVTSGQEVWTDENVVPATHLGLGLDGRHSFHPNGFVYGCPHFAMYRRADLDETCARWGVGLGSAGLDIPDETRARLETAGHLYRVYDTGKVVNILLQLDGKALRHVDSPELLHIGGMSHFLTPWCGGKGGEIETPGWAAYHGMEPRLITARFTAALLRSLIEGTPAPDLPSGLDPAMEERLLMVRREVVDLVERYRTCSTGPVGAASR
jgi:hypothetical protein